MNFTKLYLRIVSLLVLPPILAVSASAFPATASQYTGDIKLDLRKVPFSRYGSYMAFSHLPRGRIGEDGLYLRSVHGGVRQEVFRVELLREGTAIPFTELATPTLLKLESGSGFVEMCFAEPYLLRIRVHGVDLRFSKIPSSAGYAFAGSATHVEFNSPEQDIKFMFTAPEGRLKLTQDWNGTSAKDTAIDLNSSDDEQDSEVLIEEFRGSWNPREYKGAFSESLAGVRAEYRKWLDAMPSVPTNLQPAAELAAYIDWSAVVEPEGHLTRPAMLMSKNWMNAVWSWDHCFNAMMLAKSSPDLSWNQFMLVFDKQNEAGQLPDRLSDREMTWAFSKPPIHGWALKWMMEHSDTVNRDQLREAYEPLARWTNWYFKFRDDDHDGLPQYNHGNDSGWDNSTVFAGGVPVETPDLASFLVLQMQTLSEMATRLNRTKDSEEWKGRSDKLLQSLLKAYWRDGRFVALHSGDHAVVTSDSLLLYLPLILGKQLPVNVRQKLVLDLKEKGVFLTEHGLATEKTTSTLYESDGYWRGPIWAPSTMILVEGLEAVGEKEFAQALREKYCDMVAIHGMGENYDAITGQNLRDPDYTWSASVFLLFAHQLSELKKR